MNTFETFKKYVNEHKISSIITRKSIMSRKMGLKVTVDKYRLWCTRAGYLKWKSRGVYKLTKKLPESISSRSLGKKAYPNTWNKNW